MRLLVPPLLVVLILVLVLLAVLLAVLLVVLQAALLVVLLLLALWRCRCDLLPSPLARQSARSYQRSHWTQ